MSGHLEAIYTLSFSVMLATAAQMDSHIDDTSIGQLAYALGFGGMGASLGALAASLVTTATPKEMRRRFQIHLLIGIPTGIGSGYSLGYYLGHVPTWACILSASAVCGWMGVKAMIFAESKLTRKK